MKLHLEPEQIKNLNKTILKAMADCEQRSNVAGGEAEVYYVDKIKINGRNVRYYVIVENCIAQTNNYCANLWDDTGRNACIYSCERLEEMRQALPKEIERLKAINAKLKNENIEKE